MLDARLQADGELGLLVMDGDGVDGSYYAAYQHLIRLPEKEFAWNWYRTLGERVHGTFEV